MIGILNFKDFRLIESDSGECELVLSVPKESTYAAKAITKSLRERGAEYTAKIELKKNKRSLDQNSLMWALLTIYAEAQGGGRRGSVKPEDIYMRMLSKYGVAEFIMTVPAAEETLKNVFKVISKVDTRDYNGKEMAVFKCYYGSSTYDTKQMSDLINGIFDELSIIGIDASTSRDVQAYHKDWKEGLYK